MKGKELGQLILEGLLITKNGSLVVHDGTHVGTEGIHIMTDEDPMLLCLIPVCIKTSNEVLHLVL